MEDRGMIFLGLRADRVLFDPETVRDNAAYQDSRKYASGAAHVVLDGRLSIETGKYKDSLKGKVLLRPSF
jgi:N-acyl-D-amino-acid deacylase